MKKTIFTLFIISLFLLLSCNFLQNNEKLTDNIGSLTIEFLLNNLDITRSIISDFSQVVNGKVFLQQNGVIKYQTDLVINTVNKTGEGTISDIVIGTYDVILELYDSASEVIYSGTDIVTINSDSTSSSIITLSKNSAILSITGNWIEDINSLATSSIHLSKNSVVKYAGNLILDTINKTITGGINNIQPGSYDIYIEIKDTAEMICFTVNETMVIHKGSNNIALILIVKTGNIEINITGDVSAPIITVAPAVSVAGQDVTITWSTNENATSNICYSTTSGFNYQTSTNWAPIGQDLTADNTNHSITIQGLVLDQSYYYVVVSVDAAGNMIVSDEMSFVVAEIPRNGLVGEWLFAENANDTSGNENNGTIHEAAISTDRFGNANKAYNFDGINDYIVINNSASLCIATGTYAAWVYPIDTASLGYIFVKDIYGGPDANYWIVLAANKLYAGAELNGSSPYELPSTNSIPANTWIFVAGVYDGTKFSIYINGVMSNYIEMPGTLSQNSYPLYIGCDYNNGSSYYDGRIDDIRVYNRALSAAEISALYHEGGW